MEITETYRVKYKSYIKLILSSVYFTEEKMQFDFVKKSFGDHGIKSSSSFRIKRMPSMCYAINMDSKHSSSVIFSNVV